MNQHLLREGDPPGQIIRLAPYEPRDSQGRTLEVARYQDRSRREEDAERRLLRPYRPLLFLNRLCDGAAYLALFSLPFSSFVLWFLLTLEFHAWTAFGSSALLYLVLYAAVPPSALQARLRRLQAEAQESGVDLSATEQPFRR